MTELTRDERVESYYHQSAWELAESLVDAEDEVTKLRSAWRAAAATIESWRRMFRRESDLTRDLLSLLVQRGSEAGRYRSAWLSARRRAADEANFGMEALELKNAEISRLRVDLDALRESAHGAPRLEYMGADDDGTVWRLAETG